MSTKLPFPEPLTDGSRLKSEQHGFFRKNALLLAITCAGLLLRIYLFSLHQVIDWDGPYYATLGKNLLSGDGYRCLENVYQWYYPPLYPIAVGMMWKVLGNLELCAKLVSLIFGILCIPMSYHIAKVAYGSRCAVLASAIVALHPEMIRLSTTDTAEAQFTFLFLVLTLLGLVSMARGHWHLFVVLGVVGGLLFLSKPAGSQYVTASVMALVCAGAIIRAPWTKSIVRALAVIGPFAIISLPYIVLLREHYGIWTMSELPARNMVISLLKFEGKNEAEVYALDESNSRMRFITEEGGQTRAPDVARTLIKNPGASIKRYYSNLQGEIRELFRGVKVFAVGIVFLIFWHFYDMWRSRGRWENECVLGAMLLPLGSMPVICEVSSRWLLPAICVLAIWTCDGIAGLEQRLSIWKHGFGRLKGTILGGICVLLFAGSATWPMVKGAKEYAKNYPHEHKQMGIWMKENLSLGPKDTVMSATPQVAFYAGIASKTTPWGSASQVMSYARRNGVRYLVLDDHFLGIMRNQLGYFENLVKDGNSLRLIKQVRHSNGKSIGLYEIVQKDEAISQRMRRSLKL